MEAAIGTDLLDRNTADRLLAETDLPSLRDPGGVLEGKLGINAAASDWEETEWKSCSKIFSYHGRDWA
jgi:hypothetical protein